MRNLGSILAVALLFPVLTACSGPQSTMHYYQLAPVASQAASEPEPLPTLALGIGPVSIPEMLKRQEIVLSGGGNQYRLADLGRWAGLLEKNLTSVIIENLGRQLGTDQVAGYPWGAYFEPNYRIIVDVLRLTGQPGGLVTLRAGWTIVDRSGEQLLVRKISEYQQQSKEQNINALVQSESQAVALLCQEISGALRELEKL